MTGSAGTVLNAGYGALGRQIVSKLKDVKFDGGVVEIFLFHPRRPVSEPAFRLAHNGAFFEKQINPFLGRHYLRGKIKRILERMKTLKTGLKWGRLEYDFYRCNGS